ncbi:class I SAM-dependent methyltransferase [Planctomicrobium sp. SH668]|uniref:class I SAM-dependent methyltransferase n=1 Tax=Planctomicrobium sp. SH668 TaxID=3448126 RepID=UPI003F5B5172
MNAKDEIEQGVRFSFGKNWASFLTTMDESRIQIAMQSLRDQLKVDTLEGKTFLDVGCGSGLFSLAARRLGARVTSFDYDAVSVACARELRKKYDDHEDQWVIQSGSALDLAYLKSLGTFDVVYSWGVLHHTGAMWDALENVIGNVNAQGKLVVAIYNDQGIRSKLWRIVKQIYCSNFLGKWLILWMFIPWFLVRTVLVSLIRMRNEFAAYRRNRGMSIMHDWFDWLGGYPFEVATFDKIQKFYESRGFTLLTSKRTHRLGCNEFCFVRSN